MAHARRRFILQDFLSYGLTFDRGGDFRCGARWHASGGELRLDREFHFSDSIGDLYSRVTELLALRHAPMSTKSNGSPRRAQIGLCRFFKESSTASGCASIRLYWTPTLTSGLVEREDFEGLGPQHGDTPPDALKPTLHTPVQHTVEQAVLE